MAYVATFFRATSTQLRHNSYFFGGAISSEQLLFLRNSFLDQSLLCGSYFFQNSCIFRAKLLPSSQFLRIVSSLGQLLCRNSYFFNERSCSEQRYLQNSYFFEVGTSTQQQNFQNRYFFNENTFSKEVLLHTEILYLV